MKTRIIIQKTILLLILFCASQFTYASESSLISSALDYGFLFWFSIVVVMVVFIASMNIFYVLMVFSQTSEKTETVKESIWDIIRNRLTKQVPIENEEEILFHHEYDGIRELDNRLPPWWIYMFYLSILFSVVYMYHYHVSGSGDLQVAEYEAEIKEAEVQQAIFLKSEANSIDENNVSLLTDKARIKKGHDIFTQNCAACHGKAGEGAAVGPNLSDEYWLHKGGIKNIFTSIKYGIPEKGMISWKTDLTPAQIQEVASYILSLKGSNPPNAKAAQGEKMK